MNAPAHFLFLVRPKRCEKTGLLRSACFDLVKHETSFSQVVVARVAFTFVSIVKRLDFCENWSNLHCSPNSTIQPVLHDTIQTLLVYLLL